MSKDHFPVNDKTIVDVNKANARAYSADADDSTPEQRTERKEANPNKATQAASSTERNKLAHKIKFERGVKKEEKGITFGFPQDDHVRESSQEKGESHDKAGSTPTGRYAQTPSHKIGETPKMSIKNEKIAAKIAKGLSKVMQRQG